MNEEEKQPSGEKENEEALRAALVQAPEAIVLLTLAASADAADFFGYLMTGTIFLSPLVILTSAYGISISTAIALWSFLRNPGGGKAAKAAVKRLAGSQVLGFTATRTLLLVIMIGLNNRKIRRELGGQSAAGPKSSEGGEPAAESA